MTAYLGADIDAVYTSLDEGKTPALGDVVWIKGKAYKFIQYKEGAAATDGVAGEVVGFYAPSGTSAGSYTTVTSDYSDTARVGAGVLVTGMSEDEYGWIQIKGPATLSIALTAGADGDPLTIDGAGDGTLDVVANDAASGYLSHVCAVAIDASANIILCDFPF